MADTLKYSSSPEDILTKNNDQFLKYIVIIVQQLLCPFSIYRLKTIKIQLNEWKPPTGEYYFKYLKRQIITKQTKTNGSLKNRPHTSYNRK